MANEAVVTTRVAQESSVARLARFFPDAMGVRIPVRVTRAGSNPIGESTIIEFGTPEEVLFSSALPLEFEDKVLVENADGSLRAEASVIALQYHNGSTAVAARFARPISNWIIKR